MQTEAVLGRVEQREGKAKVNYLVCISQRSKVQLTRRIRCQSLRSPTPATCRVHARKIPHTHATNINQSCDPTLRTTKMRETNRRATKTLAMTKKVIETARVTGRRVSILTGRAPPRR